MDKIIVTDIIGPEYDFNLGILVKYVLSNNIIIIRKFGMYEIGDEIDDDIIKKYNYNNFYETIINNSKITYHRDVSGCNFNNNYSSLVKIVSKEPIPKADRIELIKFDNIKWQVISQKNLNNINDEVYYITPGTIIPLFLIELLDLNYLSKGLVKTIKLKGIRSEGMIITYNTIKNYLDYIFEYNEPEIIQKKASNENYYGYILPKIESPDNFDEYNSIKNLKNINKETFADGDLIWYSIKYHGQNIRFMKIFNPKTKKLQVYVGSHHTVRSEFLNKRLFKYIKEKFKFIENLPRWIKIKLSKICDYISENLLDKTYTDDHFWKILNNTINKDMLPVDYEFFGEVYGPGMQKGFDYGLHEPTLIVFDIKYNNTFLNPKEIISICKQYNIPCVNFTMIKYNEEKLYKIANQKLPNISHPNEGIVIVLDKDPNVKAKIKSDEYLEFK